MGREIDSHDPQRPRAIIRERRIWGGSPAGLDRIFTDLAAALPSCVIWYSNEGLSTPPWHRRHRALGTAPVCSALGLGIKASAGPNPLNAEGERTAIAFTAGELRETSDRLHVIGLETSPLEGR